MRALAMLIAIAALLFVSCERGVVFKDYKKLSENVWYSDVVPEFEVEIGEEAQPLKKAVMLRHGGNMPYHELLIELTVTDPSGKTSSFEYTVTLVDEAGEWAGDGMGNTFDFEFPVLEEMEFNKPGIYTVAIAQKMQQDLPLVVSIGFKVYEH